MTIKFACIFGLTAAIGTYIGWEEVGPSLKSMEIAFGLIAAPTLMIGAILPGRSLKWMLVLIAGIALLNIALNGNYAAVFFIFVASAGTFMGAVARRALFLL